VKELAWLSLTQSVAAVSGGELESQALVRSHLERIRRHDPRVHAYIHVDPDATPGSGPLSGAALAVKDTQPVAGMPWTYGSRRWRRRTAERDAVPVARARSAGAAILGKTNTPELAASVGTVNELFPPTENPRRAGFTPGGSSGGSAAAVAAGLCSGAFGDDMGGSIRIPASCCGITGLRPSPGRVPAEVPDPTRLSVRGPLARTVADLRLLFEIMAAEAAAPPQPGPRRIGMAADSTLGLDPACAAACSRAAAALEAEGHMVEAIGWDAMPVAEAYRVVRPVTMGAYPGRLDRFGSAVRPLMRRGRATSGRDFYLALQSGLAAAAGLAKLLDEPYDALLTPTLGLLPMPIAEVPTFLAERWDRYTQFVLPVSFAGLPAVSLPAGLAGGLPVGVQLVGRPREEWRLLDLAAELESADGFGFQPPPGFD
jgi:Asp-tRNA(Asn)/Glu-tRNA(Gln) amidotransferase A subunit family amidase